ncbi:MAG: hypothetical protein FWC01_08615 [Treponema sp.]|nr:hypothetical protein [Treponema sp.]MCL2238071.1 hypothetical protein [Treponema sp.]
MKNALKLLGIIALVAIVGLSLAACNKAADKATAASGDSAASSSSTGSGGNTALDRLIDDFDKIVTDAAEMTRKAMAGDVAAAVQLETLMERAEAITDEFDKYNENSFSTAQKQRIAEITQKMMSMF